ncbi:LOW QUALITY PROTEIN: hypothetical protein TorRG33x02_156880 [Trema orientale]|uniref:Uncharacterized protein n=1 Tax=Trema orientale TaxID=63057 RepID=A0A2P5ESF6_TREOI|nr:LOW QUALITY PROTEIN: hypothetical protein TorRG33x02_156880 [Trema orientale]
MGKFSASSLVSHHSFPPIFFLMAMGVLDIIDKDYTNKKYIIFQLCPLISMQA